MKIIKKACASFFALGLVMSNCLTASAQGLDLGRIVGGEVGNHLEGKIGGVGGRIANEIVRSAGAMIDSEIAKYVDEADRQAAEEAEAKALSNEKSGTSTWKSTQTGHKGKVVATKTYQKNGNACRKYTHTVTTKENTKAFKGEACRNTEGNWVATSLTPMPTTKAS